MEDEQIVQLYWDRNEGAVAATEAKYGPMVLALANGILHDTEDSRESANDTWLAAWNAMPEQRPVYLGGWLAKVTRRIAVSRLRARTARKRGGGEYQLALEELGECVSDREDPESRVQAAELSAAVSRWLSGQSPALRLLFLRRYFHCDSLREAAARCGMREGAAKSALHRMRLSLHSYLEQEGFEP